jgi:hypothetical protein
MLNVILLHVIMQNVTMLSDLSDFFYFLVIKLCLKAAK